MPHFQNSLLLAAFCRQVGKQFFIIIILRQPVFVLLKDTHQTLPVGTRPDLELPSSLAEK